MVAVLRVDVLTEIDGRMEIARQKAIVRTADDRRANLRATVIVARMLDALKETGRETANVVQKVIGHETESDVPRETVRVTASVVRNRVPKVVLRVVKARKNKGS